MKTKLLTILKTLIYPVIWCRQTILDASDVCGSCETIGFSDYTNFLSHGEGRRSCCQVSPGRKPLHQVRGIHTPQGHRA